MATDNKLIQLLNSLVKINNDRITAYEKAAGEATLMDIGLQDIFIKMATESKRHAQQLQNEIKRLGGEPANSTDAMGKAYRLWTDIKANFTGKDRRALLEACEYGEDALQSAYAKAIGADVEMNTTTLQLLISQQNELRIGHNVIKRYRDMSKASL